MFDTIRQAFKSKMPFTSASTRPKASATPSQLSFMGAHPLHKKRDATPTPGATHHWIDKKMGQTKPSPTQWLAGRVQAQKQHDASLTRRAIELAGHHRGHVTPATTELFPQAQAQQTIVQAAFDDYVSQCQDPAISKPTGAIADLLTYARTGRVWPSGPGGFHGEPRNRIGDQIFGSRLDAVEFLVRNKLTWRLPEAAANNILQLHAELARQDLEHRERGAGL